MSKTMEKLIKYCDIYGDYYTMRINGANKFKTMSGGLLSLVTIIFLILIIIVLGKDFYNRNNPTVSFEEKHDSNLQDTFNIPDSLNNNKIFVIYADALYIRDYAIGYSYLNSTSNLYNEMLIDKCSEEYINEKNLYSSSNLVSFCFDLNKVSSFEDLDDSDLSFNIWIQKCFDDDGKFLYSELRCFLNSEYFNMTKEDYESSQDSDDSEDYDSTSSSDTTNSTDITNSTDSSNSSDDKDSGILDSSNEIEISDLSDFLSGLNDEDFKDIIIDDSSISYEEDNQEYSNELFTNNSNNTNRLLLSTNNNGKKKNNEDKIIHATIIANNKDRIVKLNNRQKTKNSKRRNLISSVISPTTVNSTESDGTETMYLNIIYPRISFNSESYDDPLEEYTDRLKLAFFQKQTYYLDLYFRKMEISDSQDWVFDNKIIRRKFDVNDYLFQQSISDSIPTLNIYFHLSEVYVRYNRSYEKIQTWIGIIGGIMKVVILVVESINKVWKTYFIDMYFIFNYFKIYDEQEENEEYYQKKTSSKKPISKKSRNSLKRLIKERNNYEGYLNNSNKGKINMDYMSKKISGIATGTGTERRSLNSTSNINNHYDMTSGYVTTGYNGNLNNSTNIIQYTGVYDYENENSIIVRNPNGTYNPELDNYIRNLDVDNFKIDNDQGDMNTALYRNKKIIEIVEKQKERERRRRLLNNSNFLNPSRLYNTNNTGNLSSFSNTNNISIACKKESGFGYATQVTTHSPETNTIQNKVIIGDNSSNRASNDITKYYDQIYANNDINKYNGIYSNYNSLNNISGHIKTHIDMNSLQDRLVKLVRVPNNNTLFRVEFVNEISNNLDSNKYHTADELDKNKSNINKEIASYMNESSQLDNLKFPKEEKTYNLKNIRSNLNIEDNNGNNDLRSNDVISKSNEIINKNPLYTFNDYHTNNSVVTNKTATNFNILNDYDSNNNSNIRNTHNNYCNTVEDHNNKISISSNYDIVIKPHNHTDTKAIITNTDLNNETRDKNTYLSSNIVKKINFNQKLNYLFENKNKQQCEAKLDDKREKANKLININKSDDNNKKKSLKLQSCLFFDTENQESLGPSNNKDIYNTMINVIPNTGYDFGNKIKEFYGTTNNGDYREDHNRIEENKSIMKENDDHIDQIFNINYNNNLANLLNNNDACEINNNLQNILNKSPLPNFNNKNNNSVFPNLSKIANHDIHNTRDNRYQQGINFTNFNNNININNNNNTSIHNKPRQSSFNQRLSKSIKKLVINDNINNNSKTNSQENEDKRISLDFNNFALVNLENEGNTSRAFDNKMNRSTCFENFEIQELSEECRNTILDINGSIGKSRCRSETKNGKNSCLENSGELKNRSSKESNEMSVELKNNKNKEDDNPYKYIYEVNNKSKWWFPTYIKSNFLSIIGKKKKRLFYEFTNKDNIKAKEEKVAYDQKTLKAINKEKDDKEKINVNKENKDNENVSIANKQDLTNTMIINKGDEKNISNLNDISDNLKYDYNKLNDYNNSVLNVKMLDKEEKKNSILNNDSSRLMERSDNNMINNDNKNSILNKNKDYNENNRGKANKKADKNKIKVDINNHNSSSDSEKESNNSNQNKANNKKNKESKSNDSDNSNNSKNNKKRKHNKNRRVNKKNSRNSSNSSKSSSSSSSDGSHNTKSTFNIDKELFNRFQAASDICDYLRSVNYIQDRLLEFEIIKTLLFNENQILALTLMEKPFLNKNNMSQAQQLMRVYSFYLSDEQEREEVVIDYFVGLFMKFTLSQVHETDHRLFNALKHNIRKEVFIRVAKKKKKMSKRQRELDAMVREYKEGMNNKEDGINGNTNSNINFNNYSEYNIDLENLSDEDERMQSADLVIESGNRLKNNVFDLINENDKDNKGNVREQIDSSKEKKLKNSNESKKSRVSLKSNLSKNGYFSNEDKKINKQNCLNKKSSNNIISTCNNNVNNCVNNILIKKPSILKEKIILNNSSGRYNNEKITNIYNDSYNTKLSKECELERKDNVIELQDFKIVNKHKHGKNNVLSNAINMNSNLFGSNNNIALVTNTTNNINSTRNLLDKDYEKKIANIKAVNNNIASKKIKNKSPNAKKANYFEEERELGYNQ